MAMRVETLDPALEEQLARARERKRSGLRGREARARVFMACVFLASASALALLGQSRLRPAWWMYLAFVLAYALVSSIHLEVGSGVALPTELVFVPMLFMLPAQLVPLVVAAGDVAGTLPDVVHGKRSLRRALVLPSNSIFALGPALVFLAAHEPSADWRGGAILGLAICAQFVFDLIGTCTLEWLALGASPRDYLRPLVWTFSIDVLIASFAYGMSVAERAQEGALLLLIPLVGLLAFFAHERRGRLNSVLELSAAYRGTAFLLGDVIEADHVYTGEHSRQVVDLSLGLCKQMGLSSRDTRLAEFTALLHDVGKIRIPSAIIDKPGPLTAEEWAIVETHTIEGELLLRRVGGLLAEVGRIVRSCHERWDGSGYPDGLAGAEIPLVARIVYCCDAYNAMTTERPYGRSLNQQQAIAELRLHRGSQFDPEVVDALVAVLGA